MREMNVNRNNRKQTIKSRQRNTQEIPNMEDEYLFNSTVFFDVDSDCFSRNWIQNWAALGDDRHSIRHEQSDDC